MNRGHFILKCDMCKWHTEIDEVCKSNPCPQCRRYISLNLMYGTHEELTKYIEEHLT